MLFIYEGGPEKLNYLLEGRPSVVHTSSMTECPRDPSKTSWCCCERLCSTSVNLFWRLLQCICPLHNGWFRSAPAPTMLSVQQFWTKTQHDPCAPPSILPWSWPWATFFLFSWMKKNLQREMLCWCRRGETNKKPAEALKGINFDKFKHCFELWENISVGVSHQMESSLKVTKD